MTIIEVAAILSGAAFLLFVGYLIPVLIQVRKTVAEAERLLINMNEELPPLIGKIQTMSQNVIDLTQQAKIGLEHASVFLHAVGEVGESVQRVHGFVKGSRGLILTKVASMVTGLIKGENRRFSTSPKTFPLRRELISNSREAARIRTHALVVENRGSQMRNPVGKFKVTIHSPVAEKRIQARK